MHNFEFVKPASVDEAIQALQSDEALALGGGQTLIPTMKQRLAAPSRLVALSGMAGMVGVATTADAVVVKGATPHATVAAEAAGVFPTLADLASRIGDAAVRARGTVGGSIANNDPAACYPAAALGTGATITVQGPGGSRAVAADDFFQGMFATALEEGELITEVSFPIPARANWQKFVQPASRFSLVGVFLAQYAGGVRVAVTGASESGVFRWTEAEAALSADFSATALDALTVPADGMIGDLHGTPEYRAHLVKVLTRRAVAAA